MHALTSIIVAVAAFRSVLASPKPTTTFLGTLPGDNKPCPTPVTTITTTALGAHCDIVCEPLTPLRSCSAGEPTGPGPHSLTLAASGACTATVDVINNQCGCPSCTTKSIVARETTLPGHKVCSATSTVVTTVSPQTTDICECPLVPAGCAETTVKPLPTTTLLEGCVESIVAGPGDCSNICPHCV